MGTEKGRRTAGLDGTLACLLIKSRARTEALAKKTWARIIPQHDLRRDQIYIFVSSEEDYNAYSAAFPLAQIVHSATGVKGIEKD